MRCNLVTNLQRIFSYVAMFTMPHVFGENARVAKKCVISNQVFSYHGRCPFLFILKPSKPKTRVQP